MEVVPKGKLKELGLKLGFTSMQTDIFEQSERLEVGDALVVKEEEWQMKTPPSSHLLNKHYIGAGSPKRFLMKGMRDSRSFAIIRLPDNSKTGSGCNRTHHEWVRKQIQKEHGER